MPAAPDSPWIALDATTNRQDRALALARARDGVLGGSLPERRDVRSVILGSWERSQRAGVDPDRVTAPIGIGAEAAKARWDAHPLSIAGPLLADLLADVATDAKQLVLVCDADGTLLWLDGAPAVVDAAQEVHLMPGSLWGEADAGTNAMGTALAEAHPLQVFSSEHFSAGVRGWTCCAAPVRDPGTGRLLGVIDLSGELSTAHPHSLALVSTVARLVEERLRLQQLQATAIPVRDVTPAARLAVVGSDRGQLMLGGRSVELSRRHTELLLLLALHPEGLSAERLAAELYGEAGKPVSVRAELHRLRPRLGDLLDERPYRLRLPLVTDFAELEELVREGRIREALAAYPGPLLPGTCVPRLAELRDRLDDEVRAGVLRSGDPGLLERWLRTPSGRDDFQASRSLVGLLGREDPRRAAELSRVRRLSALARAQD